MYTMKCSLQLNKNTELANDPTRGLEERLTNVVILWLKAGRKKKKKISGEALKLISLLLRFISQNTEATRDGGEIRTRAFLTRDCGNAMLAKALLLISPPSQPRSSFHAVVISTGLNTWSSEIAHNPHRNV